jgi:hypothetical protein
MKQHGSPWTDLHEIRQQYFSKIRRENVKQKKSVEKIQVSLRSDKNNGHFTGRPTYIYNISLNSSENETFPGKSCKHKHKQKPKIVPFQMWEKGTARQAVEDNTAHANCILDV